MKHSPNICSSHSETKYFFKHFARNLAIGLSLTVIFLLIGMVGYRFYGDGSWVDAYANAAMTMSGVGALSVPPSDAGKIFAGTYALLSGMVFLLVIGLIFSPIFNWIFHQVHLKEKE